MPGTATGTWRRRQRSVAIATSWTEACLVHSSPEITMLGFSNMPSRETLLVEEGIEDRLQHVPGDLFTPFDGVRAIHEHFGFDDRNEALLLAEGGITSECGCVGTHAHRARQAVADRNHRPPFGEARADLAVILEAISEPIESLGDSFARDAR